MHNNEDTMMMKATKYSKYSEYSEWNLFLAREQDRRDREEEEEVNLPSPASLRLQSAALILKLKSIVWFQVRTESDLVEPLTQTGYVLSRRVYPQLSLQASLGRFDSESVRSRESSTHGIYSWEDLKHRIWFQRQETFVVV